MVQQEHILESLEIISDIKYNAQMGHYLGLFQYLPSGLAKGNDCSAATVKRKQTGQLMALHQ